ncbi:DegT/DnrJ/EryC1/StrS family aminotransferase [Pirellulaceae bacterium SH467]
MKPIPVASADVTGNEEKYVAEAIRSSWISSSGKYLDQFEAEFAELCDSKYALSCSNGTVALHLALLGLGLRPGDEVIVPSMTYIATANAVRYCGAEPIFVDIDPETWCISPEAIETAISPRTRGIIAVHLLGHPADMDSINQIAAMNGLWVVEDAAEAHFALYKNKPVGSLGTIGTFSFFGNKILTCGEGGALTLNDSQLSIRLKMLRGQGMDPRRRYYFPITGYNFRLTNLACAMLCAQLERREEIFEKRNAIFDYYTECLSGIPGVGFQPCAPWAQIAPWMYSVTIDPHKFGQTRDDLIAIMKEAEIDSRPFFHPLHRLPPFIESASKQGQSLEATNKLGANGLMLPTYNQLSFEDIDRIVGVIRRAASSSTPLRRAA